MPFLQNKTDTVAFGTKLRLGGVGREPIKLDGKFAGGFASSACHAWQLDGLQKGVPCLACFPDSSFTFEQRVLRADPKF